MALKEFIGENRLAQVLTLLKNHIMTGASSRAAGASGFVPAPSAGYQDRFLKGNGTWSDLPKASDWQFGVIKLGDGLVAETNEIYGIYNGTCACEGSYTFQVNKWADADSYIAIIIDKDNTSDPSFFLDEITVTFNDAGTTDSVTISVGGLDRFIPILDFVSDPETTTGVNIISVSVEMTPHIMSGDDSAPFYVAVVQTESSSEYTDRTAVRKMQGATASVYGVSGLVPAPSAGDQDKVLKGDGTWGTVASDDTFTLKNQSLPFAVTTETVDYTVVDNEGDFAVNKSDIDSIVISCSTYPIAQLCVYYSVGYADHSEVFRDATEPITLTLPSGKDTVAHIAYGMDDGNLTFSILFNKHTAVAGNHVEIANTNVTANSYVEAYFNDASISTATNSVVSVRAEAGKIVFDSAKSMLNTLVCDIVVKNSGSTTSTTYTKGQTNIFSVPNGGNSAEVLEKQSSANGDVAWSPVATQMTWAQYQALTTDQKNDGRVRIITDRGHTEYAEPMTWAEYQALSEQEKNDGTFRVITDRNMSPILAEGQTAIDTNGIVTTAGGTTNTQALLDAIGDKSVFHVVATSTGEKTYAEHLSALLSALNTLTTEQKMRCFLKNGNNMFTLGNMSSGTFTNVATTNAAQTFTVARLSSSGTALYTQTKIKSDGTTTFSDLSSTSENTTFELVY